MQQLRFLYTSSQRNVLLVGVRDGEKGLLLRPWKNDFDTAGRFLLTPNKVSYGRIGHVRL